MPEFLAIYKIQNPKMEWGYSLHFRGLTQFIFSAFAAGDPFQYRGFRTASGYVAAGMEAKMRSICRGRNLKSFRPTNLTLAARAPE